MKALYKKPTQRLLSTGRMISQTQYVPLAAFQTGTIETCGALLTGDGKKVTFDNTALFCSNSSEDFSQQLTGLEIVGCNGNSATIVTGEDGFACTDAKVAFEQLFGESEVTDAVNSCPGMAYLCNVEGFEGVEEEFIVSVGDSECPVGC